MPKFYLQIFPIFSYSLVFFDLSPKPFSHFVLILFLFFLDFSHSEQNFSPKPTTIFRRSFVFI